MRLSESEEQALFPVDVPAPDIDARAHSEKLIEMIRSQIESAGGAIPFSRYMELALYAPGLGYYVAGNQKFGADGDFITAPEIAPLFSRCIARQAMQVLNGIESASILEFGAGSGAMAVAILQELRETGTLPEQYLILELSPELQQRQRDALMETVPELISRVCWIDTLPNPGFKGFIVANEVLDAQPYSGFRMEDGRPREHMVVWSENGFESQWREPQSERLIQAVKDIQESTAIQLEEGYQSEVNLYLDPWVHSIAECLQEGAILLVDYGYAAGEYYHPQRHSGTAMCHYRHHAHGNAFALPGLQDLTAFVDFSAVANAGISAGLELQGFCNQAAFLINCGLAELMSQSDPNDIKDHLELSQQVKTLTLPSEMGERFKAIGFSRNMDLGLVGFASGDMRARL